MTTQLPTQEQGAQATAYLLHEIDTPVFLEKLAEFGIQPQNQTEAEQLVQLGLMVEAAEQQGTFKMAEAEPESNNFLDHAIGNLQKYAQANTTPPQVEDQALQFVNGNETAKTAALLFNYMSQGGELAPEEEAEAAAAN
jgi:type IV secretory pathway VirJ component